MQKFIIALALVVGVLGADAHAMSIFDQSKRIDALEKELYEKKDRDEALREFIKRLYENQVKLIEAKENADKKEFGQSFAQQESLRFASIFPKTANISPALKEFALMTAGGCLISVSCRDVKKYSSGSEVTIGLVNFYSVSLTDLILTVEYSTVSIFIENQANVQGQAEKFYADKLKLTKKVPILPPGQETIVSVTIPEYAPDKLKYLGVSAEMGGIRFYKK